MKDKDTEIKSKEGLLAWFGKIPQIDAEQFLREKKEEIERENRKDELLLENWKKEKTKKRV